MSAPSPASPLISARWAASETPAGAGVAVSRISIGKAQPVADFRAAESCAASSADNSTTRRPPPSSGTRITMPRPSFVTSSGPSPVRGFIAAILHPLSCPGPHEGLREARRRETPATAAGSAGSQPCRLVHLLSEFPRRTETITGYFTPSLPPRQAKQVPWTRDRPPSPSTAITHGAAAPGGPPARAYGG